MRVTRIAKQERRDRYNVFVDGRFHAALSAELLLESGIAEGDELEPGRLDPFVERDEAGKVLNKALRYLSLRPHGERELRTKLERKELDPGFVDDAFTRLRELGYLDDAAFARQWVEERGGTRGRRLLRAELRRKGVADGLIDEALAAGGPGEEVAVRELALKRLSRMSAGGELSRDVRDKLTRYLAGRGYGYDTIREVLDGIASPDASLSD